MPIWQYQNGRMDLNGHTAVMGILNITPDSFSDGGRYLDPDKAAARALELEAEGAEILDIGPQSTRPGHTPVSADEELDRLLPVLDRLKGRLSIPISVDTYFPQVARAALERGAAIINDVSGSLENGMPALAAHYGAGLVMMHAGGGADDRAEVDAVGVVRRYFQQALDTAERAGLPLACVCLDPGIGFGKSGRGDLRLAAGLKEATAGLPEVTVLVGASRKRVIGGCCGNPPPAQRLAGTLAFHTVAQLQGARVLRAHDVKEAVQAARVTDAILEESRES